MTTSRYQTVGTASLPSPNGDQIPYLRRRFLPVVDESAPARLHMVSAGEVLRPDLVAAAELGQAELSWWLADVNPVQRPSELCQKAGDPVRLPQAQGLSIGATSAQ